VSGDFPVQLATRLFDCRVELPVCPCVVSFSIIPRARHARLVADILGIPRENPRPTRPKRPISSCHFRHILARMSRGCYEDAARKLISWSLSLMRLCANYYQGGAYLLQLLDDCAISWGLLLVAFVEVVTIFWIYGNHYCVVVLVRFSQYTFQMIPPPIAL